MKRVLNEEGQRPLLNTPDKASEISELLKFRKPFYERAADIEIDTSKLDIDSVAEQIIGKIKDNEGLHS